MIHDVIRAEYKGGYRIELEFDDGARGTVDFSKYLRKGGVFERFNDPEFFRNFSVNEELGTLTWGDEVDVAPETLYAEATGRGLPSWMEPEDESPRPYPLALTDGPAA
ncbi:MAG: DUF2442 domain-containing protein [Thermodesulfobacteriota bacterium]